MYRKEKAVMEEKKTQKKQKNVSQKVIERLSLYRRILQEQLSAGNSNIFSHQLAGYSGGTAAQVRQDIRVIGYSGSTNGGYSLAGLIRSIDEFFGASRSQASLIVGIGNLGKALLSHFALRSLELTISAAFDNDPEKTGTLIEGCRCFDVEQLPNIAREQNISVGIIAVPPEAAQETADLMVRAGISGILNFAPVYLDTPEHIFVDMVDLTMSLEKVLYFAYNRDGG